ncbi:hypothetical protein QBC45DRAFT_456679 [Copromyces sp. CBS 386.78]|nr:hypothetical protein QBC45DRAFT_456679 [Copromyces sp. CBS 386.78]
MAHLRNTYYQDKHQDSYASSSSSHRQPYHDRSLHLPPKDMEHRGRPAYTTVRPFIINRSDDHHRPVRRERDDHDEHHRRVGDYVADRLVPTMLRSSDRPVEVFMNFGDAKFCLPDGGHAYTSSSRLDHLDGERHSPPNAIIYNAPGCSLTLDGRRCDRYCDNCDHPDLDRDDHGRDRHRRHDHDHRHNRELNLELDKRHHDRQPRPRSRSHIRVVSRSGTCNPSPSPSPLEVPSQDRHHHMHHGREHELEFELNKRHLQHTRQPRPRSRSRSHIRVVSHSHSRDPSPSPPPLPLPALFPIATAVEDATRSSWARVEVNSMSRADRDRDGRRGRGWSNERVKVDDVVTGNREYGGGDSRRSRSRWEKERRSMPRYSGYATYSESDL